MCNCDIHFLFSADDEACDNRDTISYVIINPSYDVQLQLNDIMLVSKVSQTLDLYRNLVRFLPEDLCVKICLNLCPFI